LVDGESLVTSADLAAPIASPVVEDFIEKGAHRFGQTLDARTCAELLADLKADRAWGADLFLEEEAFDADPQYRGVNPRAGRNLLERFADRLAFVEQAPQIVAGLTAVLGQGYRILDRKVVCGVPDSVMPGWLKTRIAGNPVNNLGPYVRPQYRDVTYFYGIDFHQDLIDFKGREADFLTLYVYLSRVGPDDAPLYLLEGSHNLGAALFPHDLQRTEPEHWRYRSGDQAIDCRQVLLLGEAGSVFMWHACTLHGTQPDATDQERISLRYLFERAPGSEAGMDRINAQLLGPLQLDDTRIDLDADGAARIKANSVNQA
jgi:hypothetical protein